MIGLFVGDGTLLIQCADVFRAAGGRIQGVISAEPRILAWAESEGITVAGTPAAPSPGEAPFDFLFSIANLTVLPEALLIRARRLAINFHDGPLPTYSGMNVPAWAIMAGETRHAVTWHAMGGRVDTGAILKTREFEIAPDETSFTLNAKCYEAGLDAFRDLVADVVADRLTPREQSGVREWFGRTRRPSNLGLLDHRRPAEELSARVRGLDYGSYPNPLALPKLWTGNTIVGIGALTIVDGPASGASGRVVSVDADGLRMTAADADVILGGLHGLDGTALGAMELGIAAGSDLPALAALSDADLRAVGKAEAGWMAVLAAAQPAEPPHPVLRGAGSTAIAASIGAGRLDRDVAAAGFAAWVALLTGRREVSLALAMPVSSPLLAPARLITLAIDPAATVAATLDRACAAARLAEAAGPMSSDLVARITDPAVRETARRAMAVAVSDAEGSDADLLGHHDLVLASTPARLIAREGRYAPGILGAMATQLDAFLAAFAADPDATLAALPLGASVERAAMARSGDEFAREERLHETFARQAARTPDRAALVADGTTLTFAELDARATALARVLAARGAAPGQIVGLCLERSADLPVAMLAIAKAGAAYLPLDPAYPADRIAFMAADSQARLIVASPATAARLALDPEKVVFPGAGADNPLPEHGAADDLAYVIYTSGSTGKPKGVMVEHRNVLNFFAGMDERRCRCATARVWLAVTSLSFDISVLELFWTLTRGFKVVRARRPRRAPRARRPQPAARSTSACSTSPATRPRAPAAERVPPAARGRALRRQQRLRRRLDAGAPLPRLRRPVSEPVGHRRRGRRHHRARADPRRQRVLPLHHPSASPRSGRSSTTSRTAASASRSPRAGSRTTSCCARELRRRARSVMLRDIETVRALWRGETVDVPRATTGEEVEVRTLPRPVQPELPVWITAAGNPETFAQAGAARRQRADPPARPDRRGARPRRSRAYRRRLARGRACRATGTSR